MKIVKTEWCPAQELEKVDYVGEADEVESLPTSGIACGSNCITPEGVYFLFEEGWKKFGGEEA